MAERHRVEHEVHYVARDPADWSREHVDRLARVGSGTGSPSTAMSRGHRRGVSLDWEVLAS